MNNTNTPARRRAGRGVDALLVDFGHHLPRQPAPTPPTADRNPLFRSAHRQGTMRRNTGWAPSLPPVAAWRMTSDQAPALWPFTAGPGLPPTGAQMGVDEFSGGSFYADPVGWTLDETLPVTNPNVFNYGDPGRGKSGTTKPSTGSARARSTMVRVYATRVVPLVREMLA